MAPKDRFTQEFEVGADALWEALVACLPSVTSQAGFYPDARRVEWTVDTTGFMWAQSMSASVEPTGDRTSVLTVTGVTRVRPSLLAPHARTKQFRTFVDAINRYLEHPPMLRLTLPTDDYYRYWTGQEWTTDPPR